MDPAHQPDQPAPRRDGSPFQWAGFDDGHVQGDRLAGCLLLSSAAPYLRSPLPDVPLADCHLFFQGEHGETEPAVPGGAAEKEEGCKRAPSCPRIAPSTDKPEVPAHTPAAVAPGFGGDPAKPAASPPASGAAAATAPGSGGGPAAAPAPAGDGTKAPGGEATAAETKEQLLAFFRKHDARNVGSASELAATYEGR